MLLLTPGVVSDAKSLLQDPPFVLEAGVIDIQDNMKEKNIVQIEVPTAGNTITRTNLAGWGSHTIEISNTGYFIGVEIDASNIDNANWPFLRIRASEDLYFIVTGHITSYIRHFGTDWEVLLPGNIDIPNYKNPFTAMGTGVMFVKANDIGYVVKCGGNITSGTSQLTARLQLYPVRPNQL